MNQTRCTVNLHTFVNYKAEEEPLVCKLCGYFKLPYDKDIEIVTTQTTTGSTTSFTQCSGHIDRDGIINFNKTY